MQKFLSIPVTAEGNQLVSSTGIKLIEQGSTTTVVITYGGGKITTITHAAAAAGDESMRDLIQNSVVSNLQQAWREVIFEVENIPSAVSGIATV
jgi:hypothetical protein